MDERVGTAEDRDEIARGDVSRDERGAGKRSARRAARDTGSLMPPKHILNAPTRLMRDLGYGKGYEYDHATEEAFSGQNYFPDGMARQEFYAPVDRGFEREIKKRLEYWAKLRAKREEG